MDFDSNSEFSNAIKKFYEQTNSMSEVLRSCFQPFIEMADQWKNIQALITEQNRQFERMLSKIRIPDSVKVILKFGDSQYVYWDFLSSSLIDKTLEAANLDAILFEYESDNNFSRSETLIVKCAKHKYVLPNKGLFEECIKAYHSGAYHLAAVGLTAVIDAALTSASKNPTHKPPERYNAILKRFEDRDPLDEKEYAILALHITFSSTVETFYKSAPFFEEEPICLNRHWIAHGRSKRDYTRLDCIKLFRLLYGIIVFNEIDNADA